MRPSLPSDLKLNPGVVAASDEDQDEVVAAANSGKKVIIEMLATCKAVACAADNEIAKADWLKGCRPI